MARSSGPALQGFVPGAFDDKVSGVRYRVYERDGRVWMSYEPGRDLSGTREFLYFIGSGQKGRTYLFSDDRYLFEAPNQLVLPGEPVEHDASLHPGADHSHEPARRYQLP